MAIPISYNVRNLIVRKTTTLMTALGIALTVAVLVTLMSTVHGLYAALSGTGDPQDVLILRRGSTAELTSVITPQNFQDIKFLPGIARDASGNPLASLELITVINLASVDAPDGVNINVRGITSMGKEIRPNIKVVSGRWFEQGRREVVIGTSIQKRFPDAQVGKKVRFGRGDWDVVGVMQNGQSASNSEILADLNLLAADYNRSDALSSVLVRAVDPIAAQSLVTRVKGDQKLDLDGQIETEYYGKQTSSAAPLEFVGLFVAIIMAVGSSSAAMNTMFAAVSRRAREVGTLRVLGFSRGSILLSFFVESVMLAGLGGILGCLLVLPLNGVTTAVGNFTTFSETAFSLQVTPAIMAVGVGFAMLLGALGGFFPARSASRKQILVALRET